MSKRDYNAIAGILKRIREGNKMTARESTLLGWVTLKIASYMQTGNPQFSRQKFLEAAGYPAFGEIP